MLNFDKSLFLKKENGHFVFFKLFYITALIFDKNEQDIKVNKIKLVNYHMY